MGDEGRKPAIQIPGLVWLRRTKKITRGEFPLWHSRLRIWHCLCGGEDSIPSQMQWVMGLVLLQQWRRLQLHLGFDTWPWNLHMC